jgi:hypothetical protein
MSSSVPFVSIGEAHGFDLFFRLGAIQIQAALFEAFDPGMRQRMLDIVLACHILGLHHNVGETPETYADDLEEHVRQCNDFYKQQVMVFEDGTTKLINRPGSDLKGEICSRIRLFKYYPFSLIGEDYSPVKAIDVHTCLEKKVTLLLGVWEDAIHHSKVSYISHKF